MFIADRILLVGIKLPWIRRVLAGAPAWMKRFASREFEVLKRQGHVVGRFALCRWALLRPRLWALGLRCFHIFDKRFYRVRIYSDAHQSALLGGFFSICFVVITALIIANNVTAYEYSYNGKVLGVVRNQDQVYETVELIEDKLSAENGAEVVIDKEDDIEFTKVIVAGSDISMLDTEEDVLDNLTYLKDVRVKGYILKADELEIGVLSGVDEADAILEQVKFYYLQGREPTEFKAISFAENVQILETETMIENIANSDAIYDKIMKGVTEIKSYTVQAGDTISGIAERNGMTSEALAALNPDIDPDVLHEGQTLRMEEEKTLINLLTTETAIYEEEFSYETVYTDSNKLYQGESIETVAGSNGTRRVTADIARVNGRETARMELSSETLVEPVTREVMRGIKELPPLIGQGSFIRPVSGGSVSSGFGYRWGRLHTGLDISCRYVPVYASDGGKVIFAGNRGDGYGKMIKIDHGGGRVTLYAHLSGFSVSVGQSVYQGQKIATSGNTGNSTGPHLHFEIQINGVPKNPMGYL
ncbi:MAG: peptidoglycan DD-metalloendopeptidase family protein [Clostridiales Family XIII bacterium]|nr:peptidoglycan DD-metalloendopeptidase family protein [Clostridiales Family XIII bacterium]